MNRKLKTDFRVFSTLLSISKFLSFEYFFLIFLISPHKVPKETFVAEFCAFLTQTLTSSLHPIPKEILKTEFHVIEYFFSQVVNY